MSYIENLKPVKTNPWLVLQEAKRHFRDEAAAQLEVMDSLVAEQDQIIDSEIDKIAIGASGRIYKFVKAANDLSLQLEAKNLDSTGTNYSDLTVDTVQNFFKDAGLSNIDSNFNNLGMSISSVLMDISNGHGFNEVMASICNAFQGANNLSYSDVTDIVNERSNMLKEDKTSLLSLLRSIIRDGKINSYSWISLLSNILKYSKDETDGGNVLLDKTKPFILQSMVSFVLTTVVPMVVSTIAYAIGAVLGAILYLISSLLSAVFSAISKINSLATEMQIDQQSLTDYVKGPTYYAAISRSDWHQYPTRVFNPNLSNDDGFVFIPMGPHHFYEWKGDSIDSDIYLNGFLNLGWNWKKVIKTIASSVSDYYLDNILGTNYRKLIVNMDIGEWSSLYSDDSFYLSQDEVKVICSDPEQVAFNMWMSLMTWNLVASYAPSADGNYFMIGTDSTDNQPYKYVDFGIDKGSANNCTTDFVHAGYQVGRIIEALRFYYPQSYWDDILNDAYSHILSHSSVTTSSIISDILAFYTVVVSEQATMGKSIDMIDNGAETVYGVMTESNYTINLQLITGLQLRHPAIISKYQTAGQTDISLARHPICYQVDSLPTDRGITLPAVTNDKLVSAIALVAIVTTAALTVSLAAKRAFKNKAITKKTARANELQEARDLYNAAPDDPEVRNYYVKTVKKYNLKASIFGWGTYDPTNNWFDSPSDASSSMASAILVGSDGGMLSNLMDNTAISITGNEEGQPQITLKSVDSRVDSSIDKTDYVIGLIRGV